MLVVVGVVVAPGDVDVLVREAGGRLEEQAEEHSERHCRDGHDGVEAFDVEQGLVFLRMEWEKNLQLIYTSLNSRGSQI